MKCLVIIESSFRHLLLATPLIRCLKQQLQHSMVHIVIKETLKEVLAHHKYIDASYFFKKSPAELITTLQEEAYDKIIDLQNDSESKKLCKALKLPALAVSQHRFQKFVLTNLKWNVMPDGHVVDQYFKTISTLGVKNDGKGLDFFISPHEETKQSDIPASHHAGYIALAIGSTHPTNKLSTYKLQEISQEVQHPIIIIGDKMDYSEGDAVAQVDPIKIYNACGKFTLQENADLLLKSRMVITYDSDYMQLAAALKKPIITIWGSTTPSLLKYVYYGDNYSIIKSNDVQVEGLWCRPCTTVGKERCPQGHFKCMKMIDVQKLVMQVHQYLGKS
jgi:heptosyltransferase-2